MKELEPIVKEILDIEDHINELELASSEETVDLTESIALHREAIERLEGTIAKVEAPYIGTLSCLTAEIESLKGMVVVMLRADDKKTVDLDTAKVQMKTTKSVKVLDKAGLVGILAKIKGGIENGVKTFDMKYLRKAMELEDAVPNDVATFEEKYNVYVTRAE